MYTVYLLWCDVTKKLYVGQTNNVFARIRAHRWLASTGRGHVVHRAIQKHGIEQFYWGVLAEGLSKTEADIVEKDMIAKYQSLVPSGYNLRAGGAGTPGLSKEQKREIARKLWQDPAWAARQRVAHQNKKQSVDTIQKRVKARYKAIKCMELNLEFRSGKEAKAWLRSQDKSGSPTAAANGTQKSAGGYTWMYV